MKAHVIIVRYDNPKVEQSCINSVLENTKDYHLTVYDNYPENENLGKLWNKLIAASSSEYICLLNSDTKVSVNWLPKLLEVFEIEDKAGIVGPSTNKSHNHQCSERVRPRKYTTVDFSTFRVKGGKPEILSGFCLVFPKRVWEEVGGFPQDYGFYGQEVNLIDRMLEKGYGQYWRKDCFVYHEGSSTVKKMVAKGLFDEGEERKMAQRRRK